MYLIIQHAMCTLQESYNQRGTTARLLNLNADAYTVYVPCVCVGDSVCMGIKSGSIGYEMARQKLLVEKQQLLSCLPQQRESKLFPF